MTPPPTGREHQNGRKMDPPEDKSGPRKISAPAERSKRTPFLTRWPPYCPGVCVRRARFPGALAPTCQYFPPKGFLRAHFWADFRPSRPVCRRRGAGSRQVSAGFAPVFRHYRPYVSVIHKIKISNRAENSVTRPKHTNLIEQESAAIRHFCGYFFYATFPVALGAALFSLIAGSFSAARRREITVLPAG